MGATCYGASMSTQPSTQQQSTQPNPATGHRNRLAEETSPYLLQHKDNPVDWRAWGPEALAEAKRSNKPILLSVGYAACHWCHVMSHESFEDEATAHVMNNLVVNSKVDREERHDIDQSYIAARRNFAKRHCSNAFGVPACGPARTAISPQSKSRSITSVKAAFTIISAAVLRATRWTNVGSCRISKKCSTTTRSFSNCWRSLIGAPAMNCIGGALTRP